LVCKISILKTIPSFSLLFVRTHFALAYFFPTNDYSWNDNHTRSFLSVLFCSRVFCIFSSLESSLYHYSYPLFGTRSSSDPSNPRTRLNHSFVSAIINVYKILFIALIRFYDRSFMRIISTECTIRLIFLIVQIIFLKNSRHL